MSSYRETYIESLERIYGVAIAINTDPNKRPALIIDYEGRAAELVASADMKPVPVDVYVTKPIAAIPAPLPVKPTGRIATREAVYDVALYASKDFAVAAIPRPGGELSLVRMIEVLVPHAVAAMNAADSVDPGVAVALKGLAELYRETPSVARMMFNHVIVESNSTYRVWLKIDTYITAILEMEKVPIISIFDGENEHVLSEEARPVMKGRIVIKWKPSGTPYRIYADYLTVEMKGRRYPHENVNEETGEVCLGSYKLPSLDFDKPIDSQIRRIVQNIIAVLQTPNVDSRYQDGIGCRLLGCYGDDDY